mmetsp:Transcript_27403/g.92101  ORF Transcript_27403/g.92101 Transcript_27403/m.92101 type:complete len:333 (-) Transcript_27403:291-1289(-)
MIFMISSEESLVNDAPPGAMIRLCCSATASASGSESSWPPSFRDLTAQMASMRAKVAMLCLVWVACDFCKRSNWERYLNCGGGTVVDAMPRDKAGRVESVRGAERTCERQGAVAERSGDVVENCRRVANGALFFAPISTSCRRASRARESKSTRSCTFCACTFIDATASIARSSASNFRQSRQRVRLRESWHAVKLRANFCAFFTRSRNREIARSPAIECLKSSKKRMNVSTVLRRRIQKAFRATGALNTALKASRRGSSLAWKMKRCCLWITLAARFLRNRSRFEARRTRQKRCTFLAKRAAINPGRRKRTWDSTKSRSRCSASRLSRRCK